MTAALQALLKRVEAGEAIGSAPNDDQRKLLWNCFPTATPPVSDAAHHARFAWGGSFDAALALHEAVLPGWRWGRLWSGMMWVEIDCIPGWNERYYADAANPARAWLIAILSALIADTEGR